MPRIGRVLEAEQSGELGHGLVRAKSLLHRYKPSATPPAEKYYYVEFDGVSSYINCGSDASLDNIPAGTFTVECWVRTHVTETTQFLVMKGDADQEVAYWFFDITVTGRLEYAMTGPNLCVSNELVSVGEWHHCVACYDSAIQLPYLALDGVWCSYATQAGGNAPVDDSDYDLLIGAGNVPALLYLLNGDIQWLRISSGDRFGVGVNFTPPVMCDPPAVDGTTIELWALDEGAGAVTAASVNTPANDGAMTDCTWQLCA